MRAEPASRDGCTRAILTTRFLLLRRVNSDQIPSNLFFKYNADLGPPYNVLIDTNFINFSIKNKLEVVSAMMDCLLAKCASALRSKRVVVGTPSKLTR